MRQRSDAEENRTALIAAASDVFAESGVDAPLDLVRMRASVGRATMYRHFPDRRSLHLALVEQSLSRFEALGGRHPDRPPELSDLLRLAALESASSPALHAVWDKIRLAPDAASFIDRFNNVFIAPLEQAHQDGRATEWLTVEDIFLAVRMIGAASRGITLHSRQIEAERALSILIEGLGIEIPVPLELQNDQ